MIFRKLCKLIFLTQEENYPDTSLWCNMEKVRIEENYFTDAIPYVPFLIDESSFVETEDGVNFKILATHETIGWVNPIDEDFDATLLIPFTIEHYQDIIQNSQSITEIAMRIFTKYNIHFSLKP